MPLTPEQREYMRQQRENPTSSATTEAPVSGTPPTQDLGGVPAPSDDTPDIQLTLSSGERFKPEFTTMPKDTASDTFLKVATGATGEGPRLASGTRGIDVQATSARLARSSLMPKLLKDMREQYPDGVPEHVKKALYTRAYREAEREVIQAYKRDRGIRSGPFAAAAVKGDEIPNIPLIDLDPHDYNEALQLWKTGELPYSGMWDVLPLGARETIAPLMAGLSGTAINISDGEQVRSYNEGLNWGGLDWLGRQSIATYASQMIAADGPLDWGGDEHLRNVQRGEDHFSLWDKMESYADREDVELPRRLVGFAATALSAIPGKAIESLDWTLENTAGIDIATPEGAEKFGDFVAAFGVALLDPDVTQLASYGLGTKPMRKLVEGGRDAWSSLRFKYKAQVFQEAADNLAKKVNSGEVSEADLIDELASFYTRIEDELGAGAVEEAHLRFRNTTRQNTAATRVAEKAIQMRDSAIAGRQTAVSRTNAMVEGVAEAENTTPMAPEVMKAALEAQADAVKEARTRSDGAREALKKAASDYANAEEGADMVALEKAHVQAKAARAQTDQDLIASREALQKLTWRARLDKGDLADEALKEAAEARKLKAQELSKGLDEAVGTRKQTKEALGEARKQFQDLAGFPGDLDDKQREAMKLAAEAVDTLKKALETQGKQIRKLRAQAKKAKLEASVPLRSVDRTNAARVYTAHASDHITKTAILSDLEAIKKSLKLTQQSFKKKAAKLDPSKPIELTDDGKALPHLDETGDAFEEAVEGLAAAMLSGDKQRYLAAIEKMQRAALVAGKYADNSMDQLLDAQIELMRRKADESAAALEAATKVLGNHLDVKKAQAEHTRLLSQVKGTALQTAGHRGAQAVVVAMQEMATAYSKMAKASGKAASPAERALVAAVERASNQSSGAQLSRGPGRMLQFLNTFGNAATRGGASGVYTAVERHIRPLVHDIAQTLDPAITRFGSDSIVVQNIIKASETLVNVATNEVVDKALRASGEATTEVGKRTAEYMAVVDWVDDFRPDLHMSHNAMDDSFWGSALPVLRAVANTANANGTRAASETETLFSALSTMWVRTGRLDGSLPEDKLGKIRAHARTLLLKAEDITFKDFMHEMRIKTREVAMDYRRAGDSPLKTEEMFDAPRAAAYAVKGVIEAASMRQASDALSAIVADLPKNTVDALARIEKSKDSGAGSLMEVAEIFADRLGMPAKLKKQTDALGKELKQGLEILDDPLNPNRFFVPRRWMQRLDKLSGIVVKSGDTYAASNTDALSGRATQALTWFMKRWNQAILAGLIAPNPRYFVNIILGNIGQVYSEMGAVQATKFAAGTAADLMDGGLKHLPFVGRRLAEAHPEALRTLQKSLPSALGSALAPTVSKFFDPALGKPGDMIRPAGAGGKAYSWKQLRKLAIDEGILTSFADSSGMKELASRTPKNALGRVTAEWRDAWGHMAEAVEQRQRVSLFLDQVVNQGVDPKIAGAKVRDALYDWNHPLSSFEEDYLKKVFMFWTFQRKSLGQAARHVFAPFSEEYAGNLANPLSRAIKTHRGLAGAQTMQTQHNNDQYRDPYANIYPWWMADSGNRVGMGTRPLSSAGRRKLRDATGKRHTHVSYSVPSPTIIESLNLLWSGLGVGGMLASGDIGGVTDQGSKLIGSLAGPMSEKLVEAMRQEAGLEQQYRQNPKGIPIGSKFDQKLLQMVGVGFYDPEDKKWYADPAAYNFYKLALPILSVNVGGNFEPFLTSQLSDNPVGYVVRQLSGVMKEHTHDPRKTLEMDRRGLKEGVVDKYKAQRRAQLR